MTSTGDTIKLKLPSPEPSCYKKTGAKGFDDDMPTAAKMELTLKINEFPVDVETVENGWKQFHLDCDGRVVTVKVKPKMFKKLEQAQETYPMWVAAIGGKMGEETANGFILDQPNIQVFERKPKPPQEETAGATAS